MKNSIFICLGIVFGIILSKAEVVSWYRIQEMFRFQSFHMYGVIFTAIIFGRLGVWIIEKYGIKDFTGNEIKYQNKDQYVIKYLVGGIIFGLGWALTGSCPGPLAINVGMGHSGMLIVFIFAILGTYVYSNIAHKIKQ